MSNIKLRTAAGGSITCAPDNLLLRHKRKHLEQIERDGRPVQT